MKSILLTLTCFAIFATSFSQKLSHKIVFSHHNDTSTVNPDSIYALSLDGQSKIFITLGYRPRVSHSGKYLAFSKGPNSNSSFDADLYLRDLSTQTETQIVSNNDYLDYYDFSPSDSQIVYSQGCSMYTVNLDGSDSYHDVGCTPCDCFSDDPAVRISDSSITYHNVHYGIYTKNYDGSNAVLVPNTVPGDLFPAWSPNGFFIAYFKSNPLAGQYVTNAIYKTKPNGDTTKLLQLASTDTLTPDPVWAKDQGTVYFIARINNQPGIYRVNANGSGIYSKIFAFDNTGSVNDYWLGLSDSVSSVLPVTLLNFKGQYAGKSVNLTWQTAQENNSASFQVEKSLNGKNFNAIGSVAAKGNSSTLTNYAYNDFDLSYLSTQQNVVYYRLKELDKDGAYNYSDVIAVAVASNVKSGVFPNPSTDGIFHFILPDVNKRADVIVTDVSGKPVYKNSLYNVSAGLIQLNNIKGIYLVKIKGDKNTITQKIVIQ